mgnify:CR=1 FL=1
MQGFEPLLRHMRVDLCCCQAAVAQQQLYNAQIGIMIDQVRSKGVAQRMR